MLWPTLRFWLRRDEGQDLTEYALIIALIVIICVAAVRLLGTSISDVLGNVSDALSGAVS